MSKPEFFVGIDVAQQHLDVAVAGEDAVWRVSYDAAGLTELCVRLAAAAPAQVVLEATGGLETEVTVALSAAGHAVVVANPRQVRAFARATGQLAKTDRDPAARSRHAWGLALGPKGDAGQILARSARPGDPGITRFGGHPPPPRDHHRPATHVASPGWHRWTGSSRTPCGRACPVSVRS